MTGKASKQSAEIPDLEVIPEAGDTSQEFQDALRVALRFISYRPRSTREVERKLALRFGAEVIEKVTHWLFENKYLDDFLLIFSLLQEKCQRQKRSLG